MAKPPGPRTVIPYGPIERIDDDLWGVERPVPVHPRRGLPATHDDRPARRREAAAAHRRAARRTGDEEARRAGRAVAARAAAPAPLHRRPRDEGAPRSEGVRPARSRDAVAKPVALDGTLDALPTDPTVRFEALAGTSSGEGVLLVTSPDGARVHRVVCDLVPNLPRVPGFRGWVRKVMGFTGGPRRGSVWVERVVTDRAALRAYPERLAATPNLAKIVPRHGAIIDDGPRVLREVASKP